MAERDRRIAAIREQVELDKYVSRADKLWLLDELAFADGLGKQREKRLLEQVFEIKRLEKEVAGLKPLHTLIPCSACHNGVRYAVLGMCAECAEKEMTWLQMEFADACEEKAECEKELAQTNAKAERPRAIMRLAIDTPVYRLIAARKAALADTRRPLASTVADVLRYMQSQ